MTAPTASPISNQRGLRTHIGHRHRIWNTTVDRRQPLAALDQIDPSPTAWALDSPQAPADLARRPRTTH
ncbi:hypothetical protein [Dietzia maris]|uniref:hypothetical protein n=1 Tax=Dietzia maris TaxID=37915 RepID=UPI0037C58F80